MGMVGGKVLNLVLEDCQGSGLSGVGLKWYEVTQFLRDYSR